VQGSGLGPKLFLVLAQDLNTLSGNNELIEITNFADDSTLFVPENSYVSVATEFSYIQNWANDNSMIINLAKSKEVIFYNPRAKPISIPDPILWH